MSGHRHCVICQSQRCTRAALTAAQQDVLQDCGLVLHPPRANAAMYTCPDCYSKWGKLHGKCEQLASEMAAGWVAWAQRLFDTPVQASREVHAILAGSGFNDQRHGLPDPFIERCTVLLHGIVAETYLAKTQDGASQPVIAEDDMPAINCASGVPALMFAVLVARALVNDGEALYSFLTAWIKLKGEPLSPHNWNEQDAIDLARQAWSQHDRPLMGYSCRALPTTRGSVAHNLL